ncbi:MAG: hypothetical protein AAGE88_18075 [Actinomycetota bacterium]
MTPDVDSRLAQLYGRLAAAQLWADVAETLAIAALKRGSRR